jgi:hypothetical protein
MNEPRAKLSYTRLVPLLSRAFWATMLLGHLPGLCRSVAAIATGESSDPTALLTLGIASVFFAMKTADVACLRLPRGRRALIAFTICVVFLHADLIQRVLPGQADANGARVAMIVGATLIAGLVLTANRVGRPVRSGGRFTHAMRQLWWSTHQAAFAPIPAILHLRNTPHRAPPVC